MLSCRFCFVLLVGGCIAQIWVNWARHRFLTGNEAGARELLTRAMKVLEQRKHLETVAKFAILECVVPRLRHVTRVHSR